MAIAASSLPAPSASFDTSKLTQAVSDSVAFMSAMRSADTINTHEQMHTTMHLSANNARRQTLKASTEAQDNAYKEVPQKVGQTYRAG